MKQLTRAFEPRRLMRPEEVACFLGVSESTLAKWRCAKTGPPYIRIGGQVRYDARLIEQWLESRTEESDDAPTSSLRQVELQVHGARPRIQRSHRLRGHITKRERCEGDRGEAQDRSRGGPDRPEQNGTGTIQ